MSFYSILCAEAKQIFTSVSAMMIIFGGSLFYLFLYPTPYHTDTLNPQKIAIIDDDKSHSSRELIAFFRASAHLDVMGIIDNIESAKALLQAQQIQGIIVIPHHFQAHLYKRIPRVVAIMADASYLLIYGEIVNASTEAINAFNAAFKKHSHIDSKDILYPSLKPLFNTSMGYINYMLAPIFIFILHQTLIAGAGIIGGTQNQRFAQGLREHYAISNPVLLVVAKIMIFFCIYVALFAFSFGFAYHSYGVHVAANIGDFWLFSIAFILSTAAFGVFFGTILPKRAFSTQIIMLSSMPIVFLLGFMWQQTQIAPWASALVGFLPAYYGVNGLLELNQMGASFHDIWGYFTALCFLCVLYIIASVLMIYKKTLRWHSSQ